MSVETIKQELAKLSRAERRSVMSFLADLNHERNAAHRAELAAERDNTDPGNWVPAEELRQKWNAEP